MKNLFLLISLFLVLSISAQTELKRGGSFQGLNKQGDTLVASGTVTYDLQLGNDVFGVMELAVESDSVSGTSAYSAYLYESLNGVDWGTAIDTVTHSGGGDDYGKYDLINATETYYRVSIVATGATQKSNLKIWGRLNEGFVIE